MSKHNFHTHTARCQHAVGTDEAYVEAAIAAGFDLLGFADHAPWPFASGFVSPIRMPMSAFEDYVTSIRHLQARYQGQIDIRLGLESEYFPRYHDHLLRMRDRGISYYILGNHYADSEEENPYVGSECRTDDGVLRYAESAVRGMRTGLFCYLAHPDLFMRHRTDDEMSRACEEATDMICQCALEMHMPLEYNLLGLLNQMEGHSRGYPSTPFWQRAKKWHNPVILGVDAHDPEHLKNRLLWQTGIDNVRAMGYDLVNDYYKED